MCFTPAFGDSVTQRDIARAMGVSNATVSLALRGSEEITSKRREEIQAVAKKMGYRLNLAAAELSRHKHKPVRPNHSVLAWIHAWRPAKKLRSSKQFDLYWTGADEAARRLGYELEEFRIEGSVNPERLHQILETKGIRGIFLPRQDTHPDWEGFPWENYSIVRFGRSLRNPLCHAVSSDHVANGMLAFAKMRELGYKRIGLISNGDGVVRESGHLIEAGFLLAQRLVAPADRVPICVVSDLPGRGRAKSVAKWVRENRIDGILTDVADCPEILAKGGLRVPDDVGLACTNVTEISVSAGIHQNPVEIGRVGLLMLHSLISENARGIPGISRQSVVEGVWVNGDSLPDRAE